MKRTTALAETSLDDIKAALDGGTLTLYSTARPITADLPVDRSGALAKFTFASPAFGPAANGLESPNFVEATVSGLDVGTPGFARLSKADGTVVCDMSAGPGPREIKLAEVSVTHGSPVRITQFKFLESETWPEKPEYYDTRPRSGFPPAVARS